jgi:hypothetical protein
MLWSQLQKGIDFEIRKISQVIQSGTRHGQFRFGDQQILGVPQVAMQNNCMTSDYQNESLGWSKRNPRNRF